jgi:hypothetical protein
MGKYVRGKHSIYRVSDYLCVTQLSVLLQMPEISQFNKEKGLVWVTVFQVSVK